DILIELDVQIAVVGGCEGGRVRARVERERPTGERGWRPSKRSCRGDHGHHESSSPERSPGHADHPLFRTEIRLLKLFAPNYKRASGRGFFPAMPRRALSGSDP